MNNHVDSEVILQVQNLKKYFNTPRGLLHAVDDINFSVRKGETIGVVGESGCGKSTLGRVVLHLLESTDGKIFFKGEDITNVKRKKLQELRAEMQIIFQDPYSSLDPRFTVKGIIEEPLVNLGMSKLERRKKAAELMETVGLAERLADSYPHELDGGRRQRIGIARALAFNPDFIVCDEPVSALDVSIQAQVINMLKELQEELHLTYLFIAHDLSVVKYISDRIVVMYLGTIVEISETEELFSNPIHPYTRSLLSAIPVADPDLSSARQRIMLKGEIPSPINLKPGCHFAERCPEAEERCFRESPKLCDRGEGHCVACHHAV